MGQHEDRTAKEMIAELASDVNRSMTSFDLKIANLTGSMNAVKTEVRGVARELKRVNDTLFRGNGDSLVTRVRVLEEGTIADQKQLDEHGRKLEDGDDKRDDRQFKIIMAVIVAFMASVGGVVGAVVLAYFGVGGG